MLGRLLQIGFCQTEYVTGRGGLGGDKGREGANGGKKSEFPSLPKVRSEHLHNHKRIGSPHCGTSNTNPDMLVMLVSYFFASAFVSCLLLD